MPHGHQGGALLLYVGEVQDFCGAGRGGDIVACEVEEFFAALGEDFQVGKDVENEPEGGDGTAAYCMWGDKVSGCTFGISRGFLRIAREVAISSFAASAELKPCPMLILNISGIISKAWVWPPVSKYFSNALMTRARALRALRAVIHGNGLYRR